MRRITLLTWLALAACPPSSGSLGEDLDAGGPAVAPLGQWTWIPVGGSLCASGATTGFGVNLSDAGDDLFVYLQGGGACWNTGTCVPSLVQFGPLCDYDAGCDIDSLGGTLPTASHVTDVDPFPEDGGGSFPSEIAALEPLRAFDRDDPTNPFRAATFVYVPYCTGDLHDGASAQTYPVRYATTDPVTPYTIHFAGSHNMGLFLRKLHVTLPNARRVWLTGSSAGGYGATFNLERARTEFSSSEVDLLADSSPFIPTYHWVEWMTAWSAVLPSGCADCDQGMPQIIRHVLAANPSSRIGLLDTDHDIVVSWFFEADAGAGFSPTFETPFNQALVSLEGDYDATSNGKYFLPAGQAHVLWPGYGEVQSDGGFTAPMSNNDGGTNLKIWIDAWATGSPGWSSTN